MLTVVETRAILAILALVAPAVLACGGAQRPVERPDSGASRARATLAPDRFPAPSRPVASIISPMWSDERSRDDANEAGEVLSRLGVRPGLRVADIGAGSGYYTSRIARAVGPTGRVYAEDIMPEYVRDLRRRVEKEGLPNVSVVLGSPHDPALGDTTVDLALMVHMYHEIEQPFALLANLAPAMRRGGRLAVLDLDRPTGSHGTPPALLRCELEAVGYRALSFTPLGNGNGYLAVFAAPAPAAVPQPERVRACAAPRP